MTIEEIEGEWSQLCRSTNSTEEKDCFAEKYMSRLIAVAWEAKQDEENNRGYVPGLTAALKQLEED